jgi:hypothetical protein
VDAGAFGGGALCRLRECLTAGQAALGYGAAICQLAPRSQRAERGAAINDRTTGGGRDINGSRTKSETTRGIESVAASPEAVDNRR